MTSTSLADSDLDRCATIAGLAQSLDSAADVIAAAHGAMREVASTLGITIGDASALIASYRRIAQEARDSIA